MTTDKTEYDPKADLAPGVFDIRAVLSDRKLPEDEVSFYIDEAIGYELEKLSKKIDHLAILDEKDEYKRVNAELEKLSEQLSSLQYTARARGISQRRKDDILSKALSQFPYKRDLMGRDEGEQEFNRGNLQMTLFWAAMLYEVEDTNGNVQEVTPELVDYLRAELPAAAQRAINGLIEDVSGNTDWFRFAAQDADFLSKP